LTRLPSVPEQQVMVLLEVLVVKSVELPPVVPSLTGRPWALDVSLGKTVPDGGGGGGGGGVLELPPPQEMMNAREIHAKAAFNMFVITNPLSAGKSLAENKATIKKF